MRKKKKEDIIIIVFAAILALIVIVISIVALTQKPAVNETVQIKPTPTITPTPTLANANTPAVMYDFKAQDKLLDRFEHRETLSANDSFVKAKLLATLPDGEKSGYVYKSTDVTIEYVYAPDLFQVEILTKDIAQAKAEANIWLRAQGLSQQGICNLPVMFYLNFDTANELRNTNTTFSPLPNGC